MRDPREVVSAGHVELTVAAVIDSNAEGIMKPERGKDELVISIFIDVLISRSSYTKNEETKPKHLSDAVIEMVT